MTSVPRLLSQIREEVLFTMGNNGEREPDLLRALKDADLLAGIQQQWTGSPTPFRQQLEQLCAEEGIPETTYPSWMVG
mgnify:CR=1 FL=1|tara:strand:+ start:676 stop:909 length:234 start_codon:yes stop_codon:yes gene_type:complete